MNTRLTGNQYWEIFIRLRELTNEEGQGRECCSRCETKTVVTRSRQNDLHRNILNKEIEVGRPRTQVNSYLVNQGFEEANQLW